MSSRFITQVNQLSYERELLTATPPLALTSPTVTLQDGKTAKIDSSASNASALTLLLGHVKANKLPIFLELNDQQVILRALIPVSDELTGLERLSDGTLKIHLKHFASQFFLRPTHDSYRDLESVLLSALADKHEISIAANEVNDVAYVERNVGPFDGRPPGRDEPKETVGTLATPDELFSIASGASCDPLALNQTCIPFKYPRDGCWARAHEIYRLLYGRATIGKVWLYGNLRVATANDPTCTVSWRYHVAPTVSSGANTLVLDPSLFDRPVTEAEWVRKQTIGGTTARTAGSVYFRAPDGSVEDDPGFMKTASYLKTFRGKLQEMTLNSGPPPYAHCGPIA